MQHAGPAARQRRRMMAAVEPFARRLDADQLYVAVVHERVKCAHRIRSAAHAGHDSLWESSNPFEKLRSRLAPNDRLKVANHPWVRSGSDHRTDDVVCVVDIGHPVADGFRRGVLECSGTARYADDRRAHELHAEDVQRLAPHVLLAHIDDALEPESGTYS